MHRFELEIIRGNYSTLFKKQDEMVLKLAEAPFDDENDCECDENEFQCDFGMCLHKGRFCDSRQDCIDGSDEREGCGV